MRLSIVTLNFRKPNLTIACIDSLYHVYKQEFERGDFECIIVDNHSEDNSVQMIRREIEAKAYAHISLVENTKNSGFGAGNNLGVSRAKGAYILFLNNDTVVQSGVSEMLAYMESHETVALLGGPLKNFDGTPQSSSGKFYSLPYIFLLLLGMQRFGLLDANPTQITRVDWVKGALLMIRNEVFNALNGFDEKIFMYTEDTELCYRAHLLGYQVYFYPHVSVLHKDQGSTNRKFAIVHIYKNILYFYKKHKSYREYLIVKFMLNMKADIAILIGVFLGNKDLIERYQEARKY